VFFKEEEDVALRNATIATDLGTRSENVGSKRLMMKNNMEQDICIKPIMEMGIIEKLYCLHVMEIK